MRYSIRAREVGQSTSPELLTALQNLSLSDFIVEEDPFVVAEDASLYDPPFYTTEQVDKKAYVVYCGRRMGVFQSWPACDAQVTGFSGCCHESFADVESARRAWHKSLLNGTWGNRAFKFKKLPECEVHILDPETARRSADGGAERISVELMETDLTETPVRASLEMYPKSPTDRAGVSAPITPPPVRASSPFSQDPFGTPQSHVDWSGLGYQSATSRSNKAKPRKTGSKGKGKQPAAGGSSNRVRLQYFDTRKFNFSRPGDYPISDGRGGGGAVTLPEGDIWYVVIKGSHPGIYHGREEGLIGLGTSPVKELRAFGDCNQAEGYLAYAFMNSLIVEYKDGSARTVGNHFSRN